MGSISNVAGLATIAGFGVGLAAPFAGRYVVQGANTESDWKSRLAGNLAAGGVIGGSLLGMTRAKSDVIGLGSLAAMFGAITGAGLLGMGDLLLD